VLGTEVGLIHSPSDSISTLKKIVDITPYIPHEETKGPKYFAKPSRKEEAVFKYECVMHVLPPHCSDVNGAGQETTKRNATQSPVDPDPIMNAV